MKICTSCNKFKEMYHGRKCEECRKKYLHFQWLKRNRKTCPICFCKHNFVSKECSIKCKILNRHKVINSCWIWINRINTEGYGALQETRNGIKRFLLAHRCSYEVFKGEISKGMFVLHKCDNRACCNPEHLFLGSHSDNMQDMLAKGRENYPKGSLAGSSKLSENQVNEIKESLEKGIKGHFLAKKYSVSTATISFIKNNKRWKHLQEA